MRRDQARRRAVRVKRTSGCTMRGVLLGPRHRVRDRVSHDRMHEARRPVLAEDLDSQQLGHEPYGLAHRDARDRRRVAEIATLSDDRQRLRQAQRGRVEAIQTPADLRADAVDSTEPDDVLKHAQLARLWGALQGAEEFPKVKGVPARGAVRERADLVVHG
jgi:hypothetical protein